MAKKKRKKIKLEKIEEDKESTELVYKLVELMFYDERTGRVYSPNK